ncbi:hypothetical protein ACFPTX_02235 [Pseudomonas sp. GCM10022188]|uniref:hypothetical protein n=1 Tax=Pseudomonas TaxID=286 RepID=UPI001E3F4CCB|nr:hypothetical protein [Pseudomonas oryzagri]MCC6076528.1 hypothetical protein [Pseudomonas oryzagri]
MLSLESNGAIAGLPEQYSPASLDIKFSAEAGGSAEGIRINIAGNELTIPRCVVKLIKTTNSSDISLSASWYHSSSSLPHYMNIEFYDPGYNPEKWANSGYSILLSLASAKVINIEYSQVNPDESSSQHLSVDLSSLCQEKELADFLDGAPTS